MATTNITFRMDAELKKEAKEVLDELGLDFTTAYTMFTRQLVHDQALPFRPTLRPNTETRKALREVKAMEKDPALGKAYTDVSEMFEDLLK